MEQLPPARFRYGRAILTFVVATVVALPLIYVLAMAAVPNRTAEGHSVMPIGQVAFAVIVAPVVGGVAAYWAGKGR